MRQNVLAFSLTLLIGLLILGAIFVFCGIFPAYAQPNDRFADLGEGVYVIDVHDAMNDAHLGWAPLLVQFKKDHPELRVVSIAPASVSGGRGTLNSVIVLTEPK